MKPMQANGVDFLFCGGQRRSGEERRGRESFEKKRMEEQLDSHLQTTTCTQRSSSMWCFHFFRVAFRHSPLGGGGGGGGSRGWGRGYSGAHTHPSQRRRGERERGNREEKEQQHNARGTRCRTERERKTEGESNGKRGRKRRSNGKKKRERSSAQTQTRKGSRSCSAYCRLCTPAYPPPFSPLSCRLANATDTGLSRELERLEAWWGRGKGRGRRHPCHGCGRWRTCRCGHLLLGLQRRPREWKRRRRSAGVRKWVRDSTALWLWRRLLSRP